MNSPTVDPGRSDHQIMTVCGPIPIPACGVVDAHNHTWIEPVPGAESGAVLDQAEPILAELHDFARAGGAGIIDCQPGGSGRNSLVQRELMINSSVFLVAATGYHLPKYYPPEAVIWGMDEQQAYDYFLDELEIGTAETRHLAQPVRAGFIKIACQETLALTPMALLHAAAAACRATGCAVEVHTEKGAVMEEIATFFDRQGVDLRRLVLCHVDKRPDFGLHRSLAQAGLLLEYDTFYRLKYKPEENLWPLLRNMLSAGLHNAVALATDMAEAESWKFLGGGPGLAALAVDVRSRLEASGVQLDVITEVTGLNIARRMARPIWEQRN